MGRRPAVKIALRLVSILAALSAGFTAWFIVGFAIGGGLIPLISGGWLGFLTILGWFITLGMGPFVARHLWDYRESARQAGIILFGYGLLYDVVGLFTFRTAEGPILQFVTAAAMYGLPLGILLSRSARKACRP
jgi:hypothetical protein